jgi:hypothetical protein
MMGFNEICSAPTDMMHRRTPLPFRGRFLGLGTSVTIQTDSPTILRAAEAVGFLLQDDVEQESQLRWEIVSESPGTTPAKDWEGKVTVDNHSLFLSMGAEQWFAFDFESGEGAGFVAACDSSVFCDPNGERYLFEIACHVGNCLQAKPQRGGWS